MKVKGTSVYTLKTGEHALILVTENEEEQIKLYHYLSIDAYRFKKEVAEDHPAIEYISVGYVNNDNELVWNKKYIPVPKWYDMN